MLIYSVMFQVVERLSLSCLTEDNCQSSQATPLSQDSPYQTRATLSQRPSLHQVTTDVSLAQMPSVNHAFLPSTLRAKNAGPQPLQLSDENGLKRAAPRSRDSCNNDVIVYERADENFEETDKISGGNRKKCRLDKGLQFCGSYNNKNNNNNNSRRNADICLKVL